MHKCSLIQNQPLLSLLLYQSLLLYHTREANHSKTCSSEQSFEGTITYTSQTKLHSRESVQAYHDCYTFNRVLPREDLWCDWLGTSGTEMLKAEQSGPITKPLWNGAGQQRDRQLFGFWVGILLLVFSFIISVIISVECVQDQIFLTNEANLHVL